MKIVIVGAGPAGLYFARLMKKRNAALAIAIMERDGPNDTFGWAIVLSERTLSVLKESDEETYGAVLTSSQSWDNVDVVHNGQKITVRICARTSTSGSGRTSCSMGSR